MSNVLKPFRLSEIKLNESEGKVSPEVQVLRVGKFKHPQYGEFDISEKTLSEMKDNFDKRVRGIDIAFDYFHDSNKIAAGWPKKLELRENGSELWALDVEWTPRARKMLADKELRYFSPDFAFEWTDPESGAQFSNVLFGGGLTNRPFVKGMDPIISLSESQEIVAADSEDLQTCVSGWVPKLVAEGKPQEQAIAIAYSKCGEAKLAELKNKKGEIQMDEKDKKIAELEKIIADMKAKSAKEGAAEGDSEEAAMMAEKMKQMEADKVKLAEENKQLKEQAKLAEREGKFNLMLSEGKACVAQKDAYLKGDMDEFIKLAEPLNLEGKGTTRDDNSGSKEDKILKLAEDKVKANPSLSFGDAVSIAKKELK